MQAHLFEAPSGNAETLVISYYPLVGNHGNTGPRYEREATLTNFDILGIIRQGSDTLTYSPDLRQKLSPGQFDDYWTSKSDFLADYAYGYDRVIVRGQSVGAFPALSIVKKGVVKATHLVIDDGINTRKNRRGTQRHALTAGADWAISKRRETKAQPDPLDPAWRIPAAPEGKDGLKKFAIETLHWGALWRSDYGQSTLLEIASTRPDLPMLVSFVGHTAMTTNLEVETLRSRLALARLARQKKSHTLNADLRANYHTDAWHNILEYPEFGAKNLLEAAAMTSYVHITT
ncbi:MAG: hypothetical protein JWO41_823 [Candidatus Saccharibacteria bacterium]|nr:hypothetical protein [Candidatus Saccharibacteria bacterium]